MKTNAFRTLLMVPLLLLVLADLANAADTYGPPPPAGYMERLSHWWTGVKNAVKEKIAGYSRPSVQNQQAQVPVAAPTPEQKLLAPKYELGAAAKVMEETGPAYARVFGIKIEPVQTQPVLVPKPTPVIQVSSIPEFKPRSKRLALPMEPGVDVKTVLQRKKYAARAAEDMPEVPRSALTKNTKLIPLSNEPLIKIDPIPPETFKLVSALFAWLLDRGDEALGIVHQLALKTQNELMREKALAFTGWILQGKSLKALASLSMARALASSPVNKDSLSYDNALATELSRMSREAPIAKEWPKTAMLEKIAHVLSPDGQGYTLLLQAERAYDKGAFAQSRKLAQSVPSKSTWKEQARYLAATALFAQKENTENYQTAGRELTELFRTVEDQGVFDATAVSLGRIHFILGNYKAAHQYLSQVSRDTNVFIEAAVDNAWALLRDGDRNHAVGNMFTLHTPYFDGAYMPESYFLQSLGYQEICQFGDALTSVKQYKQVYGDSFRKLTEANSSGKDFSYYDDLTSYLSHKDHKLSGIVLRELGRHPEFLRRQKILNQLAREESGATQAFPSSGAGIVSWVSDSTNALRSTFKGEINKFMRGQAVAMEDELKFLTANVSLLEYEIFAGAGNNLSLQGAQNFAVDEKAVPTRKFEEGKEYWPYEDEIWEDELNNFRSKMVDGCAKIKKQQT